jgi:RimJ/RimL family protein N-acetyltransferase
MPAQYVCLKTTYMYSIRPAAIIDIPQIRALEKELIEHERGIAECIKDEEDLFYYNISEIIHDADTSRLLVAEKDGEIIACGMGQIRLNKHYYKEKCFGYIGLMSVKKEYRGNGYGGEIIKALQEWFKTKKIAEVKLKVFANNLNAVNAYKKLGFKDFSIDMRLEI